MRNDTVSFEMYQRAKFNYTDYWDRLIGIPMYYEYHRKLIPEILLLRDTKST